ncbi:MAG TPA: hypothetical protein VFD58_24640 [Blastocatellia bacterium]|nr:hypothetical protein [Blastocatellia bacterium]
MQRSLIIPAVILCLLAAVTGFAQDKLEGTWDGKVQAPQGERPANVIFKKEGDKYTGSVTGIRADNRIPFKEITVDGSKVTAVAEVQAPQGNVVINYNFTVEGETMKGQGSVDYNGNVFTFDYDLKRTSTRPAEPAQGQAQQQQPPRRVEVPQPQQKQSVDYFVGQWGFKYIGRESALGPAPREGTVTFTRRPDGKSVEGRIEGRTEAGAYRESSLIVFDEATKMLTVSERLAGGAQVSSRGDWTSPIAIRFTVEPVKIKGQTLQLRRTVTIVSAHSFTVTEELSEDGGPFVRLGHAVYSKVGAK